MYLLYISYDDESKEIKNKRFNTDIIGIYNKKYKAIKKMEKIAEEIITSYNDKNGNWFVKELELNVIDNKNIEAVYQVFNDEIDNFNEMFYIILEKVKEVI